MIKNIPHPVLRAYYDPSQNCVVDVVEIKVKVPGKYGAPPKEVTLEQHIYCDNEEIQKQHRRNNSVVEVIADVE